MSEVLKLHNHDKPAFTVQATHFSQSGTVIRKLEIEKIIRAEGLKPVKVAAKNSMVYAAVKSTDPETGEERVTARIYETSVNKSRRDKHFSYTMYTEDEYMPLYEYLEKKDQLESIHVSDSVKDAIKSDIRYCFPTGCHSKVLKVLTKTSNENARTWRTDCQDTLMTLASEKLSGDSLTNLPLLSKIKLHKEHEDGSPIYLVKDRDANFKYPIWIDDDLVDNAKYKIADIQKIGFDIIEIAKPSR